MAWRECVYKAASICVLSEQMKDKFTCALLHQAWLGFLLFCSGSYVTSVLDMQPGL